MRPSKRKKLTVDVGVIPSLGRESIKDHTTAVLELVKNSYDAGATIVDVEIFGEGEEAFIRIADNGQGMTEHEIDQNWLRIGYSGKIAEKYIENRRRTGEKGIGRLSSDRLGSVLEMKSLAKKDGIKGVIINWDDFSEMGNDIDTVEIDYFEEDVVIDLPQKDPDSPIPTSGTELIIRKLRQEWLPKDIDELYEQLAILVSPFDSKVNFDIRLNYGGDKNNRTVTPSEISNYFEIKLVAKFNPSDQTLKIDLWNRKPNGTKRVKQRTKTMALEQVVTLNDYEVAIDKAKVGEVEILLIFYPRKSQILLGSKFRLGQLKEYLDRNSGIKLYRDSIRVKPYGDLDQPGGDWLNLGARFARNPAGRGRPDHRIRPSQLVGAIFIGRDSNPELSDSASREGLIQYDGFRMLHELIIGCIRLVEAESHGLFVQEEGEAEEEDNGLDKDLETVNKRIVDVRDDLKEASKALEVHSDDQVKEIGENISVIVDKLNYASESIEYLENQTRLFRGLATIGIASAVFGHETNLRISRLVGSVTASKKYLEKTPPDVYNSIKNLEQAVEGSNRVMAWGGFALDRIRRDKRERRKEPVNKVIESIISELNDTFKAADIEIIDSGLRTEVESMIFKIDIESIVLNLLTNAFTACKQNKKDRRIAVTLEPAEKGKQKGFTITVSDTGPGVNEKLRDIIWEPAFSTKSVSQGATEEGTGMGLAIVDSIVDELKGTRNVDDDPNLGGAKFEVWLPFVGKK